MLASTDLPLSLTSPLIPGSWTAPTYRRWNWAKQFGDFTIAYSASCQRGLKYFETEAGFQAYATRWGYTFALGDPVAAPRSQAKVIEKFCAVHRRPCFVHVAESTAEQLNQMGYYVNQMGVDTHLNLGQYDFSGKSKEPFRYASNWLRRRGYQVRELTFDQIDEATVAELSLAWRATRTVKNREVGFMNRPLVLEDEPDVRKFFLLDARERLQGFVFFDPVYRNGKVIGYSTAIKRRRPNATSYAEQGIMKSAVERFKNEGIESVRLGLSPLSGIKTHRFRRNEWLHRGWRYGYQANWVNRHLFNVQGHAVFKRKFRGNEVPVYFATPALLSEFRTLAMLRLMGVL